MTKTFKILTSLEKISGQTLETCFGRVTSGENAAQIWKHIGKFYNKRSLKGEILSRY